MSSHQGKPPPDGKTHITYEILLHLCVCEVSLTECFQHFHVIINIFNEIHITTSVIVHIHHRFKNPLNMFDYSQIGDGESKLFKLLF